MPSTNGFVHSVQSGKVDSFTSALNEFVLRNKFAIYNLMTNFGIISSYHNVYFLVFMVLGLTPKFPTHGFIYECTFTMYVQSVSNYNLLTYLLVFINHFPWFPLRNKNVHVVNMVNVELISRVL